jgi:DNA-binding MarR family transcriptional regulator
MDQKNVRLTPESKALLEQLIRERDAAVQRLDVALLATKAAQGVPTDWQIRNLDEGFVADVIAPTEA